jgi:hypothetical protein
MRAAPAALLLLSLLCACADENRTETESAPANDRTNIAMNDTAPPLTRVTPGRTDSVTIPTALHGASLVLRPLGTALLSGQAALTAKGEITAVAVRLAQGSSGATFDGAIRLGSCGALGATVASLNPATVDSLGGGRADTDVPISIDSLTHAPFALVYGRNGRPQSCGELPKG